MEKDFKFSKQLNQMIFFGTINMSKQMKKLIKEANMDFFML